MRPTQLLLTAIMAATFLVLTGSLFADPVPEYQRIPESFTVQGFALDSAGFPIPDGVYPVTFTTYHDSLCSVPVYTETQSLEIQGGRFGSIVFGLNGIGPWPRPFHPTIDIYPSRYLKISIDGQDILPIIELQSAPTAVMARQCSRRYLHLRRGDDIRQPESGFVRVC